MMLRSKRARLLGTLCMDVHGKLIRSNLRGMQSKELAMKLDSNRQ